MGWFDPTLDCVLIGYHETDLASHVKNLEAMQHGSGAFANLLANIVNVRGRWLHYMDLLNLALQEAHHRDFALNTMTLPSLGVCYLASYLQSRALRVKWINNFDRQTDELLRILQKKPLAVAITTTFYVEKSPLQEIVNFVRAHSPQTYIITGGPFIFSMCAGIADPNVQDYLFREIGADFYINDSQGEATLYQLLALLKSGNCPNFTSVPNLIVAEPLLALQKKSSHAAYQFVRTSRVVENNDLDRNTVDWQLFPQRFLAPTLATRTSRGCHYSCAFCNFPVLGGKQQFRSLESLEQEFAYLHEVGVKQLILVDDTLNLPLPRFKQMLQMMIRRHFQFQWCSFFRCGNADKEAFELMQASGCTLAYLGIESGDQQILDNMNKMVKLEQLRQGIAGLQAHGIATLASCIVGFPGETTASVARSIDFINETQPTFLLLELYYHSLLAPINNEAARFGIQGAAFSWRHDTMDWQTASRLIGEFYRRVSHSLIFPSFMFGGWSLPYLLGKGITMEQIKEFARLARPLLLKNWPTEVAAISVEDTFQAMVALAKTMRIL